MPKNNRVLINSGEIKSDKQFESARDSISHELNRIKFLEDKGSLKANDFHRTSRWMNSELEMMQKFLDLMKKTKDVPPHYVDTIERLRNQATELGSKFPKASSDDPGTKHEGVETAAKQSSVQKNVALDQMINHQIKKLDVELMKLLLRKDDINQRSLIAQTVGSIKDHFLKFKESKKDIGDFNMLKINSLNEIAICKKELGTMKDPILTRVFHALVNAVKTLLSYLDYVQSLFTGKTADQHYPGRTHWISSPVSPVLEAKIRLDTFDVALKTMHDEVNSAYKNEIEPPKP